MMKLSSLAKVKIFSMGGGGCNGRLFDAAVVESTCGAVEGYSVSCMPLTVLVEKIGCVYFFAVQAE